MEKPRTTMMKNVPINESGMAITGMATVRGDPIKRKTTKVTIASASSRALITSSMAASMKTPESYTILTSRPGGMLS